MESLVRIDSIKNCLEKAIKIVDNYSRACGVPCRVMNLQGELIYPFNQNIWSLPNENVHSSNDCAQFNRIRNITVSVSSTGLVIWSVPILETGCLMGILVAGPVQLQDQDVNVNTFIEQIQRVPVMSAERIYSLSKMLQLAARTLSDDTSNYEIGYEKTSQDLNPARNWEYNHKLIENCIYSSAIYPFDKENQLFECVETGDRAGAQKVLNEILGAIFFANSANQYTVLTRVTELVVLLSRAAIRGGADAQQIFGLNFACLKKIHTFRTVDEIAYWLSEILARFTDQVLDRGDVRHAESITKAKNYVKKNYMKRIALEDVAAHVFLSPTYFSRIFKEMTGKNFNVYVNEVRIEAAKRHLVDEKASMIDISLMTGFEDQSYFSKVFKRMTGLTPNKYRESRGRATKNQIA